MRAAGIRAGRRVVDFALPPRCPGCGAVTEAPHRFCVDCWQRLTFLGDPCCARCGLPFEFDRGEGAECGACLASPPAFDRVRAAVAYGEIARKVVLKLKYGGKPATAATIAHFMLRHLRNEDAATLLIPVPLHRWRLWRRGYNQSALIARSLARITGHEVAAELLVRRKATPVLKGLGRRERALAVRGAFLVRDRKQLHDADVILVDDVYTSGATSEACARALKRAGAARVNILCWARVVSPEGGD